MTFYEGSTPSVTATKKPLIEGLLTSYINKLLLCRLAGIFLYDSRTRVQHFHPLHPGEISSDHFYRFAFEFVFFCHAQIYYFFFIRNTFPAFAYFFER